ncbi:MAG: carbohydrate deacetylase [Armatimonadota bacterium]
MERAPITLVVNADDFGLSEGINRGIESAFQQGILRSASIMPNGAAFDDAVHVAVRNPGLGVGIHLSLVDESCIAPPDDLRGLVDACGRFPASYTSFAKGYCLRRFGLREVQLEVKAQIAKVLGAGVMPTHIDSHQHVHLLPGIFDVVLAEARSTCIDTIRIPHSREVLSPFDARPRAIQSRVLFALCRIASAKARAAGMRFADHFWGLGTSGHMNEANLMRVLRNLRPGTNEIMMHPGFADTATAKRYPWGYEWDAEASALTSDSVRRFVDENGIYLASFGSVTFQEK